MVRRGGGTAGDDCRLLASHLTAAAHIRRVIQYHRSAASSSLAAGSVPGGVTTEVDAPSDATESQYGQACRAATLWMDTQPGDRRQLIEPYLAQLQTPEAVGPGTFGTTWALLSRAQQAGVVMAVEAAADGECG